MVDRYSEPGAEVPREVSDVEEGVTEQPLTKRVAKRLASLLHRLPIVLQDDEYEPVIQGIDPGNIGRATEADRLTRWRAEHPNGLSPNRLQGSITLND